MAIYQSCPPATADQFRPMIAENMIGNSDKFLVGVCSCGWVGVWGGADVYQWRQGQC